jgi:fermentation-respiration switch protein FrsA (DUF1100 family)
MKRVRRFPAAVLAFVVAGTPCLAWDKKQAPTPAAGVNGLWLGTLKAGAVDLRLLFKIERKADGTHTGTMDSIDQGARGIPIDGIQVKDGKVRLELKKIKAVFEGTLKDGGAAIVGQWKQLGPPLPLTIHRTDKAPALVRPQEPKKPYPYAEHEVVVENKAGGVKLAGTLTVPRGKRPFPAVVLLTGSGPQDRDETVFGHKPFLVIADHLTRRGIAVLRLDDRGVGGSTGDTFKATLNDLTGDALAAVGFLKERAEIDGAKIGLIGHSEGGLVAPLAASRSSDVAFIVLLAGTGLPGEDILYLQGQAIMKSVGAGEKDLKRQRMLQELLFTVIKKEKDDATARKLILKKLAEEKAKLPAEEQKEMAVLNDAVEAQLKVVLTPWFRFFLTYDPRPALRKIRIPVLALIGAKDLQVPAKENLKALGEALQQATNKDYTLKEMPGLNHLFQRAKTGAIAEYGQIQETIAPAALEEMTRWILQRTKVAG